MHLNELIIFNIMTQEEKELLLIDLSARLPYGVIAQVSYKDGDGWKTEYRKVLGIYTDEQVYVDCVYTDLENVKPYLRPMSSMTEEERNEYFDFRNQELQRVAFAEIGRESAIAEVSDWLNEHYFDYRGLIEKGLALEASDEMYKNN